MSKVLRALLVRPVLRALRVLLEPPVLQVRLALLATLAPLAPPALPAPPGARVMQAWPAPLAR